MKLLFTRFPLESARGGAENQTMTVMRGLGQRGHAVAFLGSCPALLAMCREENIPCVQLDIGPPPVTAWGAVSFMWRAKRMRKRLIDTLMQFQSLDAVVMLSLSEKLLLTEPAVRPGIHVFWLEHDRVGRWLRQNPWLRDLVKLSERATTIVVSELSKKIYEELGFARERIVAIPNGIDLSRFTQDAGLRIQDSPLRLGCVTRLSLEKGVDVLIDAVKDLPDVTLEIVGTGREAGTLKQRAAGNHRITFIERVDDLATFYKSLDAFVLPSRDHDPFGLVAAEAMACGVPVIVTDACGIAGYLEDGRDALMVKAGSVEVLRQAIERLGNSGLRAKLVEEGKRTTNERLSLGRMLDAYENLFIGK